MIVTSTQLNVETGNGVRLGIGKRERKRDMEKERIRGNERI